MKTHLKAIGIFIAFGLFVWLVVWGIEVNKELVKNIFGIFFCLLGLAFIYLLIYSMVAGMDD